MFLKNELDLVPGVYKCYGDINNLKFKVRLEIIKSSMIPLSSIDDQDSGLDPQYYEREELEFAWNEKCFGDRELELYRDERNCTSNLEREYYDRIKALPSDDVNPVVSRRLFTYTSKDSVPTQLHRNVFYDKVVNSSFFGKISTRPFLQREANSIASSEAHENKNILPVKNLVDNNPSELQRRQNRSLSPDYEIMYVVADLSDKSKKSEPRKDEKFMDYLLFTITWNHRTTTLSVMPDLAAFNTAGYKIDVDSLSDTRYVYRYWLLNISPAEDQSNKNVDDLNERVMVHHNMNFSVDFELPHKNMDHLFAFIELQKIQGFSADNLFVQYFIDLPSKWNVENADSLYGITHQCRPKKNNDVAFLSSIFEVKLFEDVAVFDEETRDPQIDAPQLFFEVCSLDSWKRFRVEGYAWMPFPTSSGYHKMVLESWRPVSSNRRQQLRRFFIGADYEIADVKYCGSAAADSNVLARYGFETVSSGSVHLVVNLIRQTCPSATKPKKIMYSLNSWKTNKLMNNVNTILEAFKKARQRMLSVREPISAAVED